MSACRRASWRGRLSAAVGGECGPLREGRRASAAWGGGIVVSQKSREWGGLDGLTSSSEEEDQVQEAPNMLDRRQRYARMAKQEADAGEPAEERAEEEGGRGQRRRSLRACLTPLLLFFLYNSIDVRLVLLVVHHAAGWLVMACLAPSCIFLAVVEACLAWTDRDVARMRFQLGRRQAFCSLLLFQAFVIVVLGCGYGYHLVRAYRNLRHFDTHRSFLAEVEALEPARQALAGTARRDAWGFAWGPPLILSLASLLARGLFTSAEAPYWGAILAIATVGLVHDAASYDYSASEHIRTQYGTVYDVAALRWVHRAHGARILRRFQLAHWGYRTSECAARVCTFAALAAASRRLPKCIIALLVCDCSAGFLALSWAQACGPSLELGLASVAVFFVDVVRFVDEPGFAYLARRVSRLLQAMRLGEVLLAAAACLWLSGFEGEASAPDAVLEGPPALVLLVCLVAAYATHLAIRVSTKLGHVRGDIFTAVARGDTGAIEESLSFDGGCTINMRICDGSRRTALHFAMGRGREGCAHFLIRRGADSNVLDDRGENALHLACRRGSLELATAILRGEGSAFRPRSLRQMNIEGEMPVDVLPAKPPPKLVELLEEEDENCFDAYGKCCSPGRSRAVTGEYSDVCSNFTNSAAEAPLGPRGSGGSEPRRRSCRESIYGTIAGGQHFHLWVGPRAQAGRMELASFMFSRGVGEEAERLIEHIQQRHSRIRLAYLATVCTLGAGGFGRVMKVQDVRSGDMFALKLQKKDRAAKQAVREARELTDKRHPFIVELVHIFHTMVFYGILMEFCEEDLNVRILEHAAGSGGIGGLPLGPTARYTSCVALALEFLHGKQVVFRDLKPENILLTCLERGDHAKLADFGSARSVEWAAQPESRMTLRAGTLAFMSGEAIEGEAEEECQALGVEWYAKRDWYGLGCCLLLMLLGERGGKKLRHGRREVLLPAPQAEILGRLGDAAGEDLIAEEELQLVISLTLAKAGERANSVQIRNSSLCHICILELERSIKLFPIQ